jgi:hypothetical protein
LPIELFREEHGLLLRTEQGITSNCEALRFEQMNAQQATKTMVRSLNTLNPQQQKSGAFFKPFATGLEDQTLYGWGPEV